VSNCDATEGPEERNSGLSPPHGAARCEPLSVLHSAALRLSTLPPVRPVVKRVERIRSSPSLYPARASGFLQIAEFGLGNRSGSFLVQADVRQGMRVLDVGAGAGRVSIPAAKRVGSSGSVIALDPQESMLVKLREYANRSGVSNVTTVTAPAGASDIAPSSVDRVLMSWVLGDIESDSRLAAMQEAYEVLVPGGLVAVADQMPATLFQSPASIRRLATQVGFLPNRIFRRPLGYTMTFTRP